MASYVYPIGDGEFRTGYSSSSSKKSNEKDDGKSDKKDNEKGDEKDKKKKSPPLKSNKNTKPDSVWSKPKYDESKYGNYISYLMREQKSGSLDIVHQTEALPETNFEKEIYNKVVTVPYLNFWDLYNKKQEEVKINFSNISDENNVSEKSINVIRKVAALSGNDNIKITSTIRTPQKQAEVMHHYIKTAGIDNQRKLYGSQGDKIIDVYEENESLSSNEKIKLMTDKINELGPSTISRHCRADNSALNVLDIAYSSLSNKEEFIKIIKKYSDELSISKIIDESKNRCIHIEIKQ